MLDLKLVNASLFTLAETTPKAHAMGVLHGRIVGFDDDILGLPARRTLDCGGAVVVPGFGDSHNHMAWFGQSLTELDLTAIDLRPQATGGGRWTSSRMAA